MAHGISIQNGVAELSYAGKTPWHGLGQRVEGLQTVDAILAAASLTWTVETRPVSYPMLASVNGSEIYQQVQIPDAAAVVRADTQAVLGVVSRRYQVVQNTEVGQMADALVTEGEAQYEVAGALDGGKRVWLLAQVPGAFEVVKGDLIRPYFLTCWGHDGRHGIAAKLTPIRVVCSNTLAAAGFGKGAQWSKVADVYIKHTRSATIRIEHAREALGLMKRQIAQTAEAYQQLASIKITDKQAVEYFAGLFPEPVRPSGARGEEVARIEAQLERWEEQRATLFGLYAAGKGQELPGVAGTAWAAFNGLTEYLDYTYPVLANGAISEVRQQSVLFGSYSDLKDRALESALNLA